MASYISGKQLRIVLFKCTDKRGNKLLQSGNLKDDNNNSDVQVVSRHTLTEEENVCDSIAGDLSNHELSSSVVSQAINDDLVLSDRDKRAAKRQKIKHEHIENESILDVSYGQHVAAADASKPKNRNEETPIQSNIDTNSSNELTARDLRALRRLNVKAELVENKHNKDKMKSNSHSESIEIHNKIEKCLKTEKLSLQCDNIANHQLHNLFSVGSLVFAKLKGFRAWPARITSESKRSYGVLFYGTNDTAIVSLRRLYKYTAYTINKFAFKQTNSKISKLFQLALKEIESDSM